MSLDGVDHDAPLAVNVDGPQGLDISGFRGAQIGFFHNLLQTVHRVVGVGQHIFVHLLHRVVVVFNGFLDLVGGIFGILQTPGFGVVHRASGIGIFSWRMVGSRVMRSGMIGSGVMNWSRMVGSVMHWRWVIGSRGIGISMMHRSRGIRIGMVWGRGVRHWGIPVGCGCGGISMAMDSGVGGGG